MAYAEINLAVNKKSQDGWEDFYKNYAVTTKPNSTLTEVFSYRGGDYSRVSQISANNGSYYVTRYIYGCNELTLNASPVTGTVATTRNNVILLDTKSVPGYGSYPLNSRGVFFDGGWEHYIVLYQRNATISASTLPAYFEEDIQTKMKR